VKDECCVYCGAPVFGNKKDNRRYFCDACSVCCGLGATNIAEKNSAAERKEKDEVNHPQHYTSHPSGVECIEITRHMNFNLGNAVKYIWRADLKHDNTIEDLEKARWYIDDEIKKRQKT
jgi:hypothetical protein